VLIVDEEAIGLSFLLGRCDALRVSNAALRARSAHLRSLSAALDRRSVELEQRSTALLARSAALVAWALAQSNEQKPADRTDLCRAVAAAFADVPMPAILRRSRLALL
jgi:hypothetical protein